MPVQDYYCEQILNGNVQVQVVAETDRVLAFHHVFRTWDTHVVVIPKQHVARLVDVDDPSLVAEMFVVMAGIIREIGFSETNYKIITNGGSYQSNQHLHFHLVSGRPLDPDNAAQAGELRVTG